ncbi:hypothetical protein BDQ17DRAFT_1540719 [Cyathus striatus]|nr:hypothetical protein BDQ17DRAFT_1540719 [Cyathus striatus]
MFCPLLFLSPLIRVDARHILSTRGDDRRKPTKSQLLEGGRVQAVEEGFLKIKCDGVKPVCGPCRKHPKDDDCEYADGPSRSRTKILEDTVSRLEARLHELEHPESSTPSVTLHDPYGHYHEVQRLSKSPPLYIPDANQFAPLSPFSPTSTSSSLPSGRHWHNFAALEAMTEPTGSSGSSTTSPHQFSSSPFLGAEEPSPLLVKNLLDKFLPHATEFGFFLHIPTFRTSVILDAPFGDHLRPSPALLSAVYVWGVHFSRSEALLLQEQAFVNRALQHASTDLIGSHPMRILHTLQAEILLAFYFFRTGRFLEAKCHTGTAVSLALGVQLHKIRSSNFTTASTIGLMSDVPVSLHPPRDNIEEGERINGFWAVVTLHKFITTSLEPSSSVCGALEALGTHIDTPWPLDVENYVEGLLNPELRGNATVAAYLAGQWTPNMQQREFQAFAAAFQSVNRLIDAFRLQLPSLPQFEASDPSIRKVLMMHALADVATIKLHSLFAYADSSSKQRCLSAAKNMISFGGLNLQEVGYVNPIMGTLWMNACHVFIDEISRVRLLNAPWNSTPNTPATDEEELMENLQSGMAALSLFSEDSSLMHYQLTKVQEAFSAI